MSQPRIPLVSAILRYATTLRFGQLFLITGALFVVDLLLPDLIPFADEIVLGLLTLLFGAWKKKKRDADDAGAPARKLDETKRIRDESR